MNAVRQRIMDKRGSYVNFAKHKDLIAFTVGADYFTYDAENDIDLEADFGEVVAVVEKDWLFDRIRNEGIDNPLDYLQNEYTWDDSYEWFESAIVWDKVVVIEFN